MATIPLHTKSEKADSSVKISPGGAKLSDVAMLAGVHLGTVRKVLRGRTANHRISEETVRKVQAAAKKLKYHPHHTARALATNQSMVIGVYVHVPTSFIEGEHGIIGGSYWGDVLAHAEQWFRQKGYDLLVVNLSSSAQSIRHCAEKYHSRQVDGILVASDADPQELEYLYEQGVPTVAIGYTGPDIPASYIRLDNRAGMFAVVDHLVELGHRNIAWLGVCHPDILGDWRERHDAVLERMAYHGLGVLHDLHWPNTPRFEHVPDFKLYEGAWAVDYLLAQSNRPSALVAIDDLQAFGAVRQLQERNCSCPQDLSVTGFDDSFFARWSRPKLTSVSHDIKQVTTRACEILLEHVSRRNENPVFDPVHETITASLIVRQSTGRLA